MTKRELAAAMKQLDKLIAQMDQLEGRKRRLILQYRWIKQEVAKINEDMECVRGDVDCWEAEHPEAAAHVPDGYDPRFQIPAPLPDWTSR